MTDIDRQYYEMVWCDDVSSTIHNVYQTLSSECDVDENDHIYTFCKTLFLLLRVAR